MIFNFQEVNGTRDTQDVLGPTLSVDYYKCPICDDCVSEHNIDFTVYLVFDRFDEFIGVFSDKENAEKVKETIGLFAWIEECQLDKVSLK